MPSFKKAGIFRLTTFLIINLDWLAYINTAISVELSINGIANLMKSGRVNVF